jgi:hypothetical protein
MVRCAKCHMKLPDDVDTMMALCSMCWCIWHSIGLEDENWEREVTNNRR